MNTNAIPEPLGSWRLDPPWHWGRGESEIRPQAPVAVAVRPRAVLPLSPPKPKRIAYVYVIVNAPFANAVWAYRVKAKLSQREFAGLVCVDPRIIARMESGIDRKMRQEHALRIAEAAGIADPNTYFREV